jgi:hypothetical protein
MEKLWADLKWLVFQAKYCAGENLSTALCRGFRTWGGVVAAVLAAIVLMIVAAWLIKKLRAYLWRRSQLKVADAETMNRYKWTGDRPPDVSLSDAELQAQIRNALRKKK